MGTVAAVQAPAAGRRTQTGDAIARWVAFAFAASILIVAVLLVHQLWASSAESRHRFGWGFLTSSQWNPVTEDFGALPFISIGASGWWPCCWYTSFGRAPPSPATGSAGDFSPPPSGTRSPRISARCRSF